MHSFERTSLITGWLCADDGFRKPQSIICLSEFLHPIMLSSVGDLHRRGQWRIFFAVSMPPNTRWGHQFWIAIVNAHCSICITFSPYSTNCEVLSNHTRTERLHSAGNNAMRYSTPPSAVPDDPEPGGTEIDTGEKQWTRNNFIRCYVHSLTSWIIGCRFGRYSFSIRLFTFEYLNQLSLAFFAVRSRSLYLAVITN